jgi:adenylylsulfate kinase
MNRTGVLVWLTGKPSSGKSTLAAALARALVLAGERPVLLDGDAVRAALSPAPGYDPCAREHFYVSLANLAALIAEQGFVVLVAATANRRTFRERARRMAPRFIEVFVDVPQAELEARDAKGLSRAARTGAVHDLPGADAEYELPEHPDVRARGGRDAAAVLATLDQIRATLRSPA